MGAARLGSFAQGQPNNSSYQTTNQPDAVGAGGGRGGSAVESNNSYQTTNQPDAVGAGGGRGGSAVESESNGGSLIIFNSSSKEISKFLEIM